MTVRGKRAKALPIMGEPSWSTGGVVDSRLPPDAQNFIRENIQAFGTEFSDWFSERLGRYRIDCEMSKTPAVSEEIVLVTDALRYLHETQTRLEQLPPIAAAYVNEACWHRNARVFDPDVRSDFEALSWEIRKLLMIAEKKLQGLPKQAGRKTKWYRDSLLQDVVNRLVGNGLKPRRAAVALSADLLRHVGVELREDPIEIEKLARGGKNQR